MKKRSDKLTPVRKTKKHRILFYIVIGGFIIILAFLSFLTGYPQYSYSFLRCGKAPVAVRYYFADYKIEYFKPGDANYPGADMFIDYVCTENEAKALGAERAHLIN